MGNIRKFLADTFARQDLHEGRLKAGDLLFFGQFIKPVRELAALSILLAAFMTIIKSVAPLFGKVFLDYVVMKQGFGQVEHILTALGLESATGEVTRFLGSVDTVTALLIAGALFFIAMQMLEGYVSVRFSQELTFNLQRELFVRVLRFPISIFRTKQTGYIASRVSGDTHALGLLFNSILSAVISNTLFLVIGTAAMLLISPTITLIILSIAPIYLVINLYFSRRIRARSYQEYEYSSLVHKHMQETMSGIEVVKTHTTEDRETNEYSARMSNLVRTRVKNSIIRSASGSVQQIVQLGIVIVIMWLGAREIQNGTMTIGDFAAFTSYAYLMSGSINGLFGMMTTVQPTLASMDRLKEMFDIVPEYERYDKNGPKSRPESTQGNIRFEHVSFSYDANKPVLTDLSFDIKAGETVTIIGPSGLGKTTIASLILKFYSPQAGAIYLDGHDLKDIDTVWLRQQIGVVSQDIFLFDDTIEKNIKYGRLSATREEVIEAARAAGIHDMITSFPEGYETIVGERGAKLSTGQRQRISIARALLRNAPILVMDEPTSALDTETEDKIKDSLKELVKGKTVLIISHRVSMTEAADRVMIVKNGKALECTPEEIHASDNTHQSPQPENVVGVHIKDSAG